MKKWNLDYYTVAVPEIDEQHEQLFNKMTHFIEMVRKGTARKELVSLLDFLEEYSKKHFDTEESAMTQYQCPTADQNHSEHKIFIRKLVEFRNELSSQGPSQDLAGRIHKELYLWFIGHIARIDKALCKVVDKKTDQSIASCNKKERVIKKKPRLS